MGFKEALGQYKARTNAPTPAEQVQVNPPEAAETVLPKETLPETEGKPEPKTEEPPKEKRGRGRPAGSKNKSSEPPASDASAPATEASAPSTAVVAAPKADAPDSDWEKVHQAVEFLNGRGYTVTIERTRG